MTTFKWVATVPMEWDETCPKGLEFEPKYFKGKNGKKYKEWETTEKNREQSGFHFATKVSSCCAG